MTDYQGRSGEALAVVHQLQDAFSERDTLYQRIDELVYLESQVDIPLAYQKTALRVRSPLPFHQSAAITAALSVNPPVVQREPVGRGMTAQKTANQIERFTEASRRRQEKEAKRRLLRLAMHALVTKGECVLKSLPRNRTVWAKYYETAVSRLKTDTKAKFSEEARAHNHWAAEYKANEALPYPVCMTDVPPESFYYVKGEDGFSQIAEVKKVPYYDTLIRFGLGLGKANGGKVTIVPQALGLPQTEWNSMMSGVPTLDMYELWDYNHCFVGETLVSTETAAQAISRRWYVGKTVEIATASGHKLTGTANHPILTERGWVPLGELVEGDRVISRRRGDDLAAIDPQQQHVEAKFSELFDLACQSGPRTRRAGAVEDFHGDGQDADIDVVPIDRQLWDRIEASLREPRGELGFALPNKATTQLTSDRAGDERVLSRRASALGGVSSSRQRGALLGSRGAIAQLRGSTPPTYSASSLQALPNRRRPAAVLRGKSSSGRPFEVFTDQIVRTHREPFAGYVYNLETENHRYSANSIVAHNCSFVLEGPWGRYEDDAYLAAGYKHPYGNDVTRTLKGPYFQALGVSTSSRRLDRQGVSTLFAFLDLYNLYNSLLTMAHNGVYHFAGWPSFARVPQPGDGMPMPPGIGLQPSPAEQRGNTKELDWAPGQLFPFDVHAVDAPRLGFDLHKMTEDVRNMLNMAMPDVLLGMGGDTSGYAENQATHLAALYFDPLIDNMEFMLAEQTAFELFLIDNVVGEDVAAYSRSPLTGKRGDAVGWLTIGPDTIQGVYEAEVKLNPKTPSNDLLELRAIGEELKLKLKSRRQAIEQRGDSYDEVSDELLEEELEEMSKPELLQRTYQELGVKDQERLAAGAARAGAAVGGPPGAPGAGLGALGQAFEPNSGAGGMPLAPTPAGGAGGAPGGVSGTPVLPQTAVPMPGTGGG